MARKYKTRVVLSENQKIQVFTDFVFKNLSRTQLADKYNVCITYIGDIINNNIGTMNIQTKEVKIVNNEMKMQGESFRKLFIPADESLCVGDVIFKR